jgi:hypothetical protein
VSGWRRLHCARPRGPSYPSWIIDHTLSYRLTRSRGACALCNSQTFPAAARLGRTAATHARPKNPHQPIRRQLNHPDAGASVNAPDLPASVKDGGYMFTTSRKQIGSGKAAYDAAVGAIKSWDQMQLGGSCSSYSRGRWSKGLYVVRQPAGAHITLIMPVFSSFIHLPGWNFTTKPPVAAGTKICSVRAAVMFPPWNPPPATRQHLTAKTRRLSNHQPTVDRQATQTVIPWSVLPAQVVYQREEAADFGGGDKGARRGAGRGAELSGGVGAAVHACCLACSAPPCRV